MLIDVIIPIYNAFEMTKQCINSVLENTEKGSYRLVLINDNSTDTRINEFIKQFDGDANDNIVINNEANLGFVKSVNIGMKISDNDVVLLNSDTEVTENWLNKMKACAYRETTIATVTPLTNNGTICSVPDFCCDNKIPDNFSLKEYALMIERTSLREYSEIPTAVGFCMYIKRSVINEIGYFDEVLFGKGYGEENDFCYRASEYGYKHVVCDDTFIYHKGSMSFGSEKNQLINKHIEILDRKYKAMRQKTIKFIQQNPLHNIQENIKLHIKLKNNKKNVLYLLHYDFKNGASNNVGGTQFHVRDLAKNIDEYNKYVLSRDNEYLLLTIYLDNEAVDFKFLIDENFDGTRFSSIKYRQILNNILISFNIDLIHVHHTINHTFDIFYAAKEFNIPICMTLHDYYYICPTINLLNHELQYCNEIIKDDVCTQCLNKKLGYGSNILDKWQKEVKKIFEICDAVFVPNSSVKDIYLKRYSKIKLKVIEHGVDGLEKRPKTNLNDKFNVAFIGGLAPYKGSILAHDMILKNKERRIKWHIFGILGDQLLININQKDLYKHGIYDKSEISDLLTDYNINLVCILSVWPETYSYTLTEAWQSGMPVLVTDIGALGERVKRTGAGWTVPADSSAEDILTKIYSIMNDVNEYKEVLDKIKSMEFISIEEMAHNYVIEYDTLIESKENTGNTKGVLADNSQILSAYKLANKMYTTVGQAELYARIEYLEREINTMRGTLGWRALERLRRSRFPFVTIFKRLIYFYSVITKDRK